MKIKLHIPTEEYGFVEIESEADSIQEAIETYSASKTLKNASGEGLDHKEWITALDRYLSTETGETAQYVRMSDSQKLVIQEIKKAIKRIAAKKE